MVVSILETKMIHTLYFVYNYTLYTHYKLYRIDTKMSSQF